MFVTIHTTGSKSVMVAVVVVVVVVVVVSQTIRCSEIVGGSDLIQFNINDDKLESGDIYLCRFWYHSNFKFMA